MLNCRRCQGMTLLELARLGRGDHTVFRCRTCGFLFSPPDTDLQGRYGVDVLPSAPPRKSAELRVSRVRLPGDDRTTPLR